MSLLGCVLLYFFINFISANEFEVSISLDYYDDGLRTECNLGFCSQRCAPWPSTCDQGFCQCYPLLARVKPDDLSYVDGLLTANVPHRKSLTENLKTEKSTIVPKAKISFDDLTKPLEGQPVKSVLRHHIAHFCPDLEVARTCIRKCMKLGQPAFCGKDHVCYCSHKYNDKDINGKIDVEAVRNQYRDLYLKYFGPELG